ncbi:MAG TPA: Maf family nucleotide pyrophosphatase [Bacteroidales bacterium]|nr:Maf family nucleotide pyrophosphatase [Bacteroidales bacterium]HRR94113.1 Maf family nucleotide pyrophosphatase [Bacteroidales bacterium]
MLKLPPGLRLVLASRSPRRQMLLAAAGLKFEVVEKDFDERWPGSLKGKEIAEYLARSKAEQLAGDFSSGDTVVITADTIVWCDGEVLGKPEDHKSAFRILKAISGKTHEVITGVGLLNGKRIKIFSETTLVTFDEITEEDIGYYVENFNPFDKAGAYGIQDWIGITANTKISGSYFNVVGLPVNRLLKELNDFINK